MSFLLLSKLSCQSIIIYPSIHPERSEGIPVCTCFFLRCDVACPRSFWTFWTTQSSTSGRFCCNDPHDMAAVALNQFIEYAAVMVQLSDAQDRLQICHTFADCNKIQKKHIRCEICGACPMACCGLLWPVMLSRSFHMFSLSACCPVPRTAQATGIQRSTCFWTSLQSCWQNQRFLPSFATRRWAAAWVLVEFWSTLHCLYAIHFTHFTSLGIRCISVTH